MGFQFDVIFIDSFMDGVTYVRDVEVCVERVIYIVFLMMNIRRSKHVEDKRN
jgi:hypothetical protein